MFRVRDYSLFMPSPNAQRAYARLRRLDVLINGLIALLVVTALWNIGKLVQLRLISNQDFASISNISDDFSSRLIWVLVPITLGLVGYREWLSGEHSMGLIYPLGALLAIVLMPSAMAEMQPALVDHTLRIVMLECPAKEVVNGELKSVAACDPFEIGDGTVLMATSNPLEGGFETIAASSGGQNTITFTMSGRGTYTVYFMFRTESMAACQQELIFPKAGSLDDAPHDCVEVEGTTYLVMPYVTSGTSVSGIHLIRVRPFQE
ncbi:MAG: hypothetical protein KC435_09935 [Thermomicrobiales bacterium]|nr:hypothetical protein [Thermomicrobiales bacterium]